MSKKNNYKYNLISTDEKNDEKMVSAFDFESIYSFKSIHKYNDNGLHRLEAQSVNTESKPLAGIEKIFYYSILCLFYAFLIVCLPFSLFFCLKYVKENEKLVVYRMGRILMPAYENGYYVIFPLIDSYQRFSMALKEFSLTNLQIFTHENAIVDVTTVIRYRINDVIKMQKSVQDLNHSLKPIARSLLIEMLSKKDTNKIEQELYYVKQDIKTKMNEQIKRWGLEVIEVEVSILSILEDESTKNGEDPAVKTLSSVFKSLLSPTSSNTNDNNSHQSSPIATFAPHFLSFLQKTVAESQAEKASQMSSSTTDTIIETNEEEKDQQETYLSTDHLIKLIEPLINENLVKQIQTVYEFHILSDDDSLSSLTKIYLNLKHNFGSIGYGSYENQQIADCVIKLKQVDLVDLFMQRLKPFNAYMNGKIEIDGNLQDVLRLKTLLNSVLTSK